MNATLVVHDLLLPMIEVRRPDGHPSARLLIGTRTGLLWSQIDDLIATTTGQVIDLDDTPPDVLRDDLTDSISDVVASQEWDGTRGHIADRVADRLVASQPDGQRWGEFMVAVMLAGHLVTRAAPPHTLRQVVAPHGWPERQAPEHLASRGEGARTVVNSRNSGESETARFVSGKTVEADPTRVCRKLDIRPKAQVAQLIHDGAWRNLAAGQGWPPRTTAYVRRRVV